MNLKPLHLAAWLLLAAIAFMTLAPIGFRPATGIPTQLERFAAFAVIGLAFGIAYPRKLWFVALVVLGAAVSLEAMQLLAMGRHAGVRDVIAKLAGGTGGIMASWVISTLRRQFFAVDGSS